MDSFDRRLGSCACAFWLAVLFDALGALLLLTGLCADLFFHDLLIYAGAILLFLSLIWWVFWFTGNIEVPPEEPEEEIGLPAAPRKLSTAAEGTQQGTQQGTLRSLSRRLSLGILHSLRNRTPKSSHRAFPRDGPPPQQGGGTPLGGTPGCALSTLPRVHTVSDFVEFDARASEVIPDV